MDWGAIWLVGIFYDWNDCRSSNHLYILSIRALVSGVEIGWCLTIYATAGLLCIPLLVMVRLKGHGWQRNTTRVTTNEERKDTLKKRTQNIFKTHHKTKANGHPESHVPLRKAYYKGLRHQLGSANQSLKVARGCSRQTVAINVSFSSRWIRPILWGASLIDSSSRPWL